MIGEVLLRLYVYVLIACGIAWAMIFASLLCLWACRQIRRRLP